MAEEKFITPGYVSPEDVEQEQADSEASFDISPREYVDTLADVDPLDHLLATQATKFSVAPEVEIESDLVGSFTHGLTLHHAGQAPDSMLSTEGLSYLLGTFIPLASYNRLAFAVAPKFQVGLSNVTKRAGEVLSEMPSVAAATARVPGAYRLGATLEKAIASKQFEFGTRVALEAGLWSATDKNLEGAEGLQEALLYTTIGEGAFAGIQRAVRQHKSFKKRKQRIEERKATTDEKIKREIDDMEGAIRGKIETSDHQIEHIRTHRDHTRASNVANTQGSWGKTKIDYVQGKSPIAAGEEILDKTNAAREKIAELEQIAFQKEANVKAMYRSTIESSGDNVYQPPIKTDDGVILSKDGEQVFATDEELALVFGKREAGETISNIEDSAIKEVLDGNEALNTQVKAKVKDKKPTKKVLAEEAPAEAEIIKAESDKKGLQKLNKKLGKKETQEFLNTTGLPAGEAQGYINAFSKKGLTPKMVANVVKRTELSLEEMIALNKDELGKLARGRVDDPIYQKYGGKVFQAKQKKITGTRQKLAKYSDKDLKKLNEELIKATKAGDTLPVELDPRKVNEPVTVTISKQQKKRLKARLTELSDGKRPKRYKVKENKRVSDNRTFPTKDTIYFKAVNNRNIARMIAVQMGLKGKGAVNFDTYIANSLTGKTTDRSIAKVIDENILSGQFGEENLFKVSDAKEYKKLTKKDAVREIVRRRKSFKSKDELRAEIAEGIKAGRIKVEKIPPTGMPDPIIAKVKPTKQPGGIDAKIQQANLQEDIIDELTDSLYTNYMTRFNRARQVFDRMNNFDRFLRQAGRIHGYHNLGKFAPTVTGKEVDSLLYKSIKANIPADDAKKIVDTAIELNNSAINREYEIMTVVDSYITGSRRLPDYVSEPPYDSWYAGKVQSMKDLAADANKHLEYTSKKTHKETVQANPKEILEKGEIIEEAPEFVRGTDGQSYSERLYKAGEVELGETITKTKRGHLERIQRLLDEDDATSLELAIDKVNANYKGKGALVDENGFLRNSNLRLVEIPKNLREGIPYLPRFAMVPFKEGVDNITRYVKGHKINMARVHKEKPLNSKTVRKLIGEESDDVVVSKNNKNLKRADINEAEQLEHIESSVRSVLSDTVSISKYNSLSPAEKLKAKPLSKQYITAIKQTIDNELASQTHGSLDPAYIGATILNRRLRGLTRETLEDAPITKQQMNELNDLAEEIKQAGLANMYGVKPGKGMYRRISNKMKAMRNSYESFDDVNGALIKRERELIDELGEDLESIMKNSREVEDHFGLSRQNIEELLTMGEAAAKIEGVSLPTKQKQFFGAIRQQARVNAYEASPLRKSKLKKDKSKKYEKSTKEDLYGETTDTELVDNLPKIMKKLNSADNVTLNQIDFNNLNEAFIKENLPLIETTLYQGIKSNMTEWIENFAVVPFKQSWNDAVAAGDKALQNQLERQFVSHLMSNPDDFNRLAAGLNKGFGVETKLYYAIRGAYGDTGAKKYLHSLIQLEGPLSGLRLKKILSTIDNPQTGKPTTDVIEDTAVKQKQSTKGTEDAPPPEEGGTPPGGSQGTDGTGGPTTTDATGTRNTIVDGFLKDPVDSALEMARRYNNPVFLRIAHTISDQVNKVKAMLHPKSIDVDGSYAKINTESDSFAIVSNKLKEKYGADYVKTIETPAYALQDDITDMVLREKQKIGKDLTAEDIANLEELVQLKLSKATPDVAEFLSANYRTYNKIRIHNNKTIAKTNIRRAAEGVAEQQPIAYLPGYTPMIADGAIDVSLNGKLVANVANKEAAQAYIEKNLATFNETDKIMITPAHPTIDAFAPTEFTEALLETADMTVAQLRAAKAEGKIIGKAHMVDVMFNATKVRNKKIYTEGFRFEDSMDRYAYGSYKYAEMGEMGTDIENAVKFLNEQGDLAGARYFKDYGDILLDRRIFKLEEQVNNIVNDGIDIAQKIPVVAEAFTKLGIKQGSDSLRAITGAITSVGSFTSLGFNIATSLLQLSILGMNVIPRLGFKPFIKAVRQARVAMKEGTAAFTKYGQGLRDLNLHLNVMDGRVDDILRDSLKLGRTKSITGLNLREQARKLKDMSMVAFNGMDKYARVLSYIASHDMAENLSRRIIKKVDRAGLSLEKSTIEEIDNVLQPAERTLFHQSRRLGKSLTDANVKDEFSKAFVRETNFTYDKSNVPFQFNNPVLAPILQFKTWVQKETMFVYKSFAQRPKGKGVTLAEQYEDFAKISGAFIALGGVFSMPGSNELDLLTRTVFGYSPKAQMMEKDNPFMDILSGGIPMGLGVSMEGRMGPGNIFSLIDTDNLFGIYPTRLYKATTSMFKGDIDRGMNYLLPRFAQNIRQGYNITQTGNLMSSYGGSLIFNYENMGQSPMVGGVLKMLGFETPNESRNRIMKYSLDAQSKHTSYSRKRAEWRIFRALDEGDTEEAYEIIQEAGLDKKSTMKRYRDTRKKTEADRRNFPGTNINKNLKANVEAYREKFK